MTRKKHQLFWKRRIKYILNKAFENTKVEAFDGKIYKYECEGLSDYYRTTPPRRWYSVTNHSRKKFRGKKHGY